MTMNIKQRKIKIEPRIKLNYNKSYPSHNLSIAVKMKALALLTVNTHVKS